MPNYRHVANVYRKETSVWPGVIVAVIVLIIIGAAIG